MAVENLTDEQLESRLNVIEQMIIKANAKDLPALNNMFQKLLDEQVRRDVEVRNSARN